MNTKYKKLDYYLNLPWTYTIEKDKDNKGNSIYIIYVNELPGVCTDASSIEEAMELIREPMIAALRLYMKQNEEIPEPIDESRYKGNIAYRTTGHRHYMLVREAQRRRESLSELIDNLIDKALIEQRVNKDRR